MTQVSIGDIIPYTQATATAGQVLFMTNWTANVASDVVVYQTPFGDVADDVTQILAYPADYSVDFIGDSQEVQVTLVTGAGQSDTITIIRNTPADRLNLYSNTNFTPSMLNNDFGILTLVDQQAQLVNQLIGPRYNYSALIQDVIDTILPILGPGQVWMKNSGDTAIIATDFVTPGGGNISSWQTVDAPSVNAASGEGFVTDRSATPVQIVLPAMFNVGDEIGILGSGAGGWSCVANTGQVIRFGSQVTSTAGAINSDIQYANLFLRGLIANSVWTVELVNSNPTII